VSEVYTDRPYRQDRCSLVIHGILCRTPLDQAPHLLPLSTALPAIMRRVSQNQPPPYTSRPTQCWAACSAAKLFLTQILFRDATPPECECGFWGNKIWEANNVRVIRLFVAQRLLRFLSGPGTSPCLCVFDVASRIVSAGQLFVPLELHCTSAAQA
jgi:hypothetical protein